MDAIKIYLTFILFIPCLVFGQESKYPKDTIYIKFENKSGNVKLSNWEYNNKGGIYFSIKDISEKHISLFYEQNQKSDTLSIVFLNDYKFSDSKEIRKKEIDWVNRKFKNSRYKPYSGGSKNSVFYTYLVEIISKNRIVVYPVIWRNEGVID